MPTLTFLIGPTAVGKTALGLAWAQKTGGEILYADAPCVYRGMDIGTAKPTPQERSLVPHHGIDWAEPSDKFTVGDYAQRAAEVVAEVTRRGKPLLVLGGSGFYLKSFFEPATDGLGVNEAVAAEVAALYEKEGVLGVLSKLKTLHPADTLEGLDVANPRRVIKALERVMASGLSYTQLRTRFEALPPPYAEFDKKVVMLTRTREDLRERITARAQAMLDAGLIEEVAALRPKLERNPQAASIIGYRETLEYLQTPSPSRETLLGAIIQNTVGLVRKQFTFFKQLPINDVVLLGAGEQPSLDFLTGRV